MGRYGPSEVPKTGTDPSHSDRRFKAESLCSELPCSEIPYTGSL